MFVLDNSGSMNILTGYVDVPNPKIFIRDGQECIDLPRELWHLTQGMKTTLEVCKECLSEQIIADHSGRLSCDDKVGLIVYDDTINAQIPLDSWQGQHKAEFQRQLQSIRPGKDATRMWHAIQRAIEELHQSASHRSKWLVALTDGVSQDQSDAVEELLRSEHGNSIRVIFITIGLDNEDREKIRKAITRSQNDLMLSADDASSLEKAWADVGETISQRIEKQGASITAAETERLLRKYMKLDGVHHRWSRMKQMHWIQYLYRRCGILAASETFNKNQDKPAFGSTTMTIMLEEVLRVRHPLTRFLSLLHFQSSVRP